MRSRRCVEMCKRYSQARRKGQSYILLAFGCLVSASAILNETKGKRICCRFWRNNSHAGKVRSHLSWTGDRSSIPRPNDGSYSQWRSANKWGSNSVRQWSGLFVTVLTLEDTPPVLSLWKSLRRSRIFLWLGQWSKITSHFKTVRKYNATRETACLSVGPSNSIASNILKHRCRRTQCEMYLHQVQHTDKTRVNSVEHSVTSCKMRKKPKTTWKM